ncbi:MAG: protein translocase subunit SecD [Candidatus Niyogibacteria bacterium]|nr:protein translocase subunit SecD [Candidatus Niyogibacteria bacterium]
MKTRIIAIVLLLLGAAVGYFDGASFLAPDSVLAKFPFRLGLDLRGGTHLVYRADISRLPAIEVNDAMDGLRDVIERRVNLFGVTEPLVQVESHQNEKRLVVELAGVTDVKEAIKMIGATPYLEFKTERPKEEQDALIENNKKEGAHIEDPYYAPSGLTGRFLKKSSVDFNQTTFEPTILLEFNAEGADIFAKLTRENVGKRLAIYLDGVPISTPVVREEITGGNAQISGTFTPDEAKTLARNLNAGALPIPIELISQQSVGASLGNEALARGILAGIYGIILLAVFLMLWYRILGVAAVLALGVYMAIVLALFKLIPVTLTAAGIAGFLLSIGVAVDANILVFERFKEEARSGKTLEFSLQEGFRRGWTSIRDSNISSLITAVVLYWFSTSMVKGFALTLGVGIIVSLFSALVVTKTFIAALGVKRVGPTASFLFGSGFKNIPQESHEHN